MLFAPPTLSLFLFPAACLSASFLNPVESSSTSNGVASGDLMSLSGTFEVDKEFDYIVIGGGTAGGTLGVRLAESGHRVAIIEAGTFQEIAKPLLSTTPAGDLIGIGSSMLDTIPTVDWAFQTEPQAGANNRRMHIAQGKCIGGSSALNFMIYHRASTETYNRWAEEVGDDSYKLNNWLPYYKRSMTFTPPDERKRRRNATTPYDSTDFAPASERGPLQVGYSNWVSSWSTWLEQGLKSVGIARTNGSNHGELLGYHYTQTTIRTSDSTRSSSAQFIYHAMAKGLRNLKVFTDSQAVKIQFDDNKRASGVEIMSHGVKHVILAKSEVILSAGVFQSPQLLMVSGIGPQDQLQKYRIPILSVLPGVGQNMWDHIFFGPSYEVNFPTLDDVLHNPVSLTTALAQYVATHDGPLSSNNIELVGWEKLPERYRQNFSAETSAALAEFPADWPEVEYLGTNGYVGDFEWPIAQQPANGKQYATILGAMVAPVSRGNITIMSASALDKPSINPNWLTARADQEVAVAWYRRMRDVWRTPELRSISIGKEAWPGEDKSSNEDILEIIKNSLMTVWHPACTCKMGKKEDNMAVVDSLARVYGVKGLRVVDASAFAVLPPGHPQSTVYALAEKIADSIVKGLE